MTVSKQVATRPVRRMVALACLLSLLSFFAAGCKKGEEGPPGGGRGAGGMSFPVEVVPVASERVEYVVAAVGSVEAFERVQLVARIAGAVERVKFKEGETVKKDQILVEIDPARYSVAVRSAKASLERALSSKAEAEAGLKRRADTTAENEGVFSGEEIDTWRTRARSTSAQVAEAQAALDAASLNLRDAYVKAPIAGKIQTRTVQTGQYVQPGTVLATLIRRDPLLLRFQIPEADAPRVQNGMTARFQVRGDARTFTAKITHVADSADMTTRMVSVTGEIDDLNKEDLRPGTFAEITVPVGENASAPVIPQTSVRPSEKGFLAYVVENGAALERVLQLGLRTADGRVEVRSGVKPDEMLVVRGAEALRDGAKVRVVPPGQLAGGQSATPGNPGGSAAAAPGSQARPEAAPPAPNNPSPGAPTAQPGAAPPNAPRSSSP
jgi:membrane fusion protein (multidrug efflux system)/multidrug efflux system membrane fusion protein